MLLMFLLLGVTVDEIQHWEIDDLDKIYNNLSNDQRNYLKGLINEKPENVERQKPSKIKIDDEIPNKKAINPELVNDDIPVPKAVLPKVFNQDKEDLKKIHEPVIDIDEGIEPRYFSYKYLWISLATVFISEIGDKTFFIVAILGMKQPKHLIIIANMMAMSLMTFISAFLGYLVPSLIHSQWVAILAGIILIAFGIVMIRERESNKIKEEYEEAKDELAEDDLDTGEQKIHSKKSHFLVKFGVSPILIQSFIMIFLAEWGDRSQLSTIALGASGGLAPVIIGSILGHALCTALAILFGHLVAQRISAKHGTSN